MPEIAPHQDGDLEELQKVLLAAERKRLTDLEDRLKNSVIDASAVANVLPDAIRLRTISPKDQHLAEAISPVIMPAIRTAVATALQDMVRYMNRTLDHDLFWRRLTWRWEALSKRKPYWEVALSHTLKYRVERVFLFFREDGVHLGDVHHPNVQPFKPGHEDLVSSMFSAIQTAVQKFNQDEFQASKDASWRTSEMTDGTIVCIEQGPKAVLAAVVRGVPSPSLRSVFQDALGAIHVELNEALQNFQGDKNAFEAARPYLESCLLQEESVAQRKTGSAQGSLSPALLVLVLLLLSALGWWGVASYLDQQREADEQLRWARFQDMVREKPGIHITSIDSVNGKNGKTIVYGLRDPLSDEPREIAQEVGLRHEAIDFQFEPYLSLQPELVARRAKDILHSPESVRLSVSNGTTVLNLTGTAPHAWIAQLQKFGSMIPGVTSIQDAELQDESRLRLDQLVREIETRHIEFEAGSSSPSAESAAAIQSVLLALRESDALAQQLGHRIQVEIHGHTSEEGSVETNRRLALARAQGIMSDFHVERFSATDFHSVAESVGPSATGEIQGAKPLRARLVSFHVTVDDAGSKGARS
jgi:outer membrane protein OmpA-like peptidoglycan-associated protein